ncbi:hypothetical protein JCM8202v2_002471 [Rhodotorula sphaerocarpa]
MQRVAWSCVLTQAYERNFSKAVDNLQAVVIAEIRAAQLRHSFPSPSSTSSTPSDDATINPSGQFRPDIVALLQAAYDAHPGPLSKADRRELARATGLTDKQITCWFGNARQRERKRRQRGASAGSSVSAATTTTRRSSVRMVPYDVEMAPHHQVQQQQQQQQYWQPVPFEQQQQRSWLYGASSLSSSVSSFSSASGSSSDLVEYAEPDASAAAMWPGMSQAAAPLSSSLAPLLVPAPPPPPMVPMDPQLSLDPTGWFCMSSPPSSSPQLGAAPPLLAPPPESFAPSPSSWSTSAAASPSPSFDAPLAVPELDFELPFGPTVPAATDAWMDDEFYRNLFGSLGLDVEGGGSGAGAGGDMSAGLGGLDALLGELAGSLGGGAGAGGGGLTLRMSEVWDGDAGLGQALQL